MKIKQSKNFSLELLSLDFAWTSQVQLQESLVQQTLVCMHPWYKCPLKAHKRVHSNCCQCTIISLWVHQNYLQPASYVFINTAKPACWKLRAVLASYILQLCSYSYVFACMCIQQLIAMGKATVTCQLYSIRIHTKAAVYCLLNSCFFDKKLLPTSNYSMSLITTRIHNIQYILLCILVVIELTVGYSYVARTITIRNPGIAHSCMNGM